MPRKIKLVGAAATRRATIGMPTTCEKNQTQHRQECLCHTARRLSANCGTGILTCVDLKPTSSRFPTIYNPQPFLDVVIQRELVGMRPQTDRIGFVFPLVIDESLDEIFAEHIALQQKLVIFLEARERLLE